MLLLEVLVLHLFTITGLGFPCLQQQNVTFLYNCFAICVSPLCPTNHMYDTEVLSGLNSVIYAHFSVPVMLDECLAYLERRVAGNECGPLATGVDKFSYEVLVVDDGSRDTTTKVVLDYTRRYGADKVRCLTLAANRGKGGAVRMVSSRYGRGYCFVCISDNYMCLYSVFR